MVQFLKNISIRNKLITIQLVTAFIAILIVSIFAFLTATRLFTEIQNKSVASLANFIGIQNEAALLFNMPQSTDFTRTDKAVGQQSTIENYTILDKSGRVFHQYKKDGYPRYSFELPVNHLQDEIGIFEDDGDHTNYYHVLLDDDEAVIGYVCIRSNKSQERLILRRYIFFTFLVLVIAAVVITLLSTYLQQAISKPILHLVSVVKRISSDENYDTRVNDEGNDEVATLSKEFNNMLGQINKRDKKLLAANNVLESRVEQKTRALREAYNTLEKRSIELEKINKELEQFAYVASHDLQEPLRTIGSFTQLLNRRIKSNIDNETQSYMDYIVKGVGRMQSVIRDLLLFSGLGRNKLNFTLTDLSKVLNETTITLKAAIDEAEGTILEIKKLPSIVVDAPQIRHLFQNLISNAIKFKGNRAPIVEIDFEEKEKFWQFSIKDNGIGIEKEYAEKIFLIFQRLHTKEEYPGTGIGLAICKKIVDYHKGKIWFESEVNEGSTFYFTISKPPFIDNETETNEEVIDEFS